MKFGVMLAIAVVAMGAWLTPPTGAAVAPPMAQGGGAGKCDVDGVERIVAVGDVHGAYDRFVDILRATKLVDDKLRWTGGRAHLVQIGDVVDRGPDSRKALDLLMELEDEAESDGGRVHALIGNHEVMRMLGDWRYVAPGEYAAFKTSDSEKRRDEVIKRNPDVAKELMAEPLGGLEMRLAFDDRGKYGKWLRGHNAVVRINGVVFVHGGLSPEVAAMPCATINDTIRQELTTDFDKTRQDPLKSLAAREDGPLWYRGLAVNDESTFAPDVDKILSAAGARAIVVAHTVTPTHRVTPRFDKKVIEMDTGMQPAYVPTGRASALEIAGDAWTAVYVDGREPIRP